MALEMKNPKEETKRRQKEILDRIRTGESRSKTLQYLKDTYNLKDRQATRLYHDSLEILQASTNINIDEIRSQYIERIEALFESSVAKGDINSALKAQEMLNKMNGLYTDKQEITLKNEVIKFKFDS